MDDENRLQKTREHWDRSGLSRVILSAIAELGKSHDELTSDDLAPLDQFHSGGMQMTLRLARLAKLEPGLRLLDVGGGLGGPARTIALEFGCRVTVIDLAESYIQAGFMLNSLVGLHDRVDFLVGDALDLPFEDGFFDVIWTQNSGMNIADKERLYAGFYRLLLPGGCLVLQELMSGSVQPPIFPTIWSPDSANHHLRTPSDMQSLIEAAGFRTLEWQDVTSYKTKSSLDLHAQTIQKIVIGEKLLEEIRRAGKRNKAEKRLLVIQAVFEKPSEH